MRIVAEFRDLDQAHAALEALLTAGASDAQLSVLSGATAETPSEAFGEVYASSHNGLSAEDSRKKPFGDTYSDRPDISATAAVGQGVVVAIDTDESSPLSEAEIRDLLKQHGATSA